MALALRPAKPADLGALLALADGVIAWLVARGRAGQWGARPPSEDDGFRARTANAVASGLVTVSVRNGAVVGAMVLDRTVPAYVPSGFVPRGALYVHTLVSARNETGAGAGLLLLGHATEFATGDPGRPGPLARQP